MLDQAVKRSLLREGTNMQLVKDAGFERTSFPTLVGPAKCLGVHDLRRSVHSFRLEARSWIRKLTAVL